MVAVTATIMMAVKAAARAMTAAMAAANAMTTSAAMAALRAMSLAMQQWRQSGNKMAAATKKVRAMAALMAARACNNANNNNATMTMAMLTLPLPRILPKWRTTRRTTGVGMAAASNATPAVALNKRFPHPPHCLSLC